ncbi:hypothetical protein JCM33374_g4956 [Metschnikowia sp. JCM 33374]|nr:hypothetical protein JCM33374_g4956 [Metschnikowia sp. JCM 33374]
MLNQEPSKMAQPSKFPEISSDFSDFSDVSHSSLSPTIRQLLASPPQFNTHGIARGHIKAIRSFRQVGFMDLSDGSVHATLSVTFNDPESVLAGSKYKVGQSVEVHGKWVESPGSQPFELCFDASDATHSIAVLGDVPDGYPIQKKRSTLQFLRTVPTLRHRTSLLASVLRFRSRVEGLLGDFFRAHDVVKATPPIITAADCEGAGEQFQVRPMAEVSRASPSGAKNSQVDHFFGKEAYLTVSTQLHLEILALSLNRAWTLTPCFRAEDSNTNRHLSEFWMLEAELCYVTHVHQLTDFVEAMVRHVVASLNNETDVWGAGSKTDLVSARYSKPEVAKIRASWDQILSENPWPSITYTHAIEVLNKIKYKGRSKGRLEWGASISTEDEKWLAGVHFQSPVFITDYPKAQKPFYMLQNKAGPGTTEIPHSDSDSNTKTDTKPSDRATVACFDLIVPELGELVGGSLREHDYATLVAEMEERGMSAEAMQWYLSTRENGSVPHGGFGMGFERLLAYLTAVENIRDISAFPRAPGVCAC